MTRIKTVDRDYDGWIARNPFTGEDYPEPGFRWFCRASARTAVWEARHCSDEALVFKQLTHLAELSAGMDTSGGKSNG